MAEPQANEPTIVFLFDIRQWNQQLTPLTKLELIDMIPSVCSQFFFDASLPAYVLTVTKSKWDGFNPDLLVKFKTLTRRIREEVEGYMTQAQRDALESADPFEMFKKKEATEEASPVTTTAPLPETASTHQTVDNEDNINLREIEAALDR